MGRVAGAFRNITILLLFIVMIYVYSGMPQSVALIMDANGNPDGFIGKNSFFYLTLFSLTIINGLIFLLNNQVGKLRGESNEAFRHSFKIWSNGLITLLNIFFITALVFLSGLNSLENLDMNNFVITAFATLSLAFIWMFGIVIVMKSRI